MSMIWEWLSKHSVEISLFASLITIAIFFGVPNFPTLIKMLFEFITGRDATGKDTTGKDTAGKDTTGKGTNNGIKTSTMEKVWISFFAFALLLAVCSAIVSFSKGGVGGSPNTPVPTVEASPNLTPPAASLAPVPTPTSTISEGSVVTFGAYPQTMEDGAWKNESITWTVLSIQDEQALLLSNYGLTYMAISSDKSTWRQWSESSLKKWLNSVFYTDAFVREERDAIISKSNELGVVFCLSKEEVERFLPLQEQRICAPTKYAVEICKQQKPTENGKQPIPNEAADYWWLRDHGTDERSFLTVNDIGMTNPQGTQGKFAGIMVRPAIWVSVDQLNGQ